jgi:hypothetical protein
MNRRRTILIVITLILLIIIFAVYNYTINIYEVIYTVQPTDLYADNKSVVTITATPINGLGWKALFRQAEAGYTIAEGKELIEILENNESEGILKLKAKDRTGIVKIIAKSPYALLPSPINILIYP